MDKILEGIIVFFFVALVYLAIMAFVAWPTMLLWNWLMPDIFSLKELTFWQTLGLMILSTAFFYRGSGSSGK